MMASKVTSWARSAIVWLAQLPWWAVTVVLFTLFFLRAIIHYDPDFGWHLAAGEYIRANGIPSNDIFTYTAQDFEWVNHEWLADVVTSYTYDIGGFLLLAVLHAAMWTGALIVAAKGIKYRALVVLAAISVLPYAGVRSATTSVVFAVALIALMRSRRLYWLVVPLMMLWANIHGSFALGLAYIFFETVRQHRRDFRRYTVAIIAVIATFANPYSWRIYEEVFRTIGDNSLGSRIIEWLPMQVDLVYGVYVGIWAAALFFSSKRWTDIVRFDTILLLMSFMSGRHMPLFVVFSLPELARFRLAKKVDFEKMWEESSLRVGALVMATIAVVIVIGSANNYIRFPVQWDAAYAPQAVSYLRENGCEGNVFNHYDFGGYMIWQLPTIPVYIDGRMPSWSHEGEKYMDRYLDVVDDPKVRKEEFARYNVRCVIWRNDSFAEQLISEGWDRKPIGTDRFVLLEKR
jgi:hypothetical protein